MVRLVRSARMSTGGVAPPPLAQAFLNGMSHDAQFNWFHQMSYPQRTAWWVVERATHPGRWFQHRGRERYHRDAVDHEAPAVFLLSEARIDAHTAALEAAHYARVALRALVPVAAPVVESVSGSSSYSGSASGNDNDDGNVSEVFSMVIGARRMRCFVVTSKTMRCAQ